MPTLYITNRDGTQVSLEASTGQTLMEAMTEHDLDVEAVCGGAASCGTCHVHVAQEWLAQVGPPKDIEADVLDGLMNADETSRLGCQLKLSERHDGLTVTTAQVE